MPPEMPTASMATAQAGRCDAIYRKPVSFWSGRWTLGRTLDSASNSIRCLCLSGPGARHLNV